jgi:hypothetical protein
VNAAAAQNVDIEGERLAREARAERSKKKDDVWGESGNSKDMNEEKIQAIMNQSSSSSKGKSSKKSSSSKEEEEGEGGGGGKRKYNSLAGSDVNVSKEEMEAYRRQKTRGDDPMTKFMSEGGEE